MQKLIIFANGLDQPGVGAAVTKSLYSNDCNILNFNMTSMEGFFALIVSVTAIETVDLTKLEGALLDSVEDYQVDIVINDVLEFQDSQEANQTEWIPYKVTICCQNRIGCLHLFMSEMAKNSINIKDLRIIEQTEEPKEDGIICAKIEVPLEVGPDDLKAIMNDLANECQIVIDLKNVDDLEY